MSEIVVAAYCSRVLESLRRSIARLEKELAALDNELADGLSRVRSGERIDLL